MRVAVVVAGAGALLLSSFVALDAGEVGINRGRLGAYPGVWVDVPLEYSTDVIFPFGGSHHAVPGIAAINGEPYRCRVHARRFRERTSFVVHLRTEHGLVDDEIPGAVILDRGEIVYLGN